MVQKAKGDTPIKAKLNISDADLEDLLAQHSAEKSAGSHVQGRQFTPYTGGPQQAKEEYQRSHYGMPAPPPSPQGQLFDPKSIPMPEVHTQTPDQFARDPRTWWHGRVTRGGVRSSLGGNTEGRGEGFHAGTREAAEIRLTHNIRRRGLKEGMAGHLYPLRITGDVEGPEQMREDVAKHIELGPRMSRWGQTTGGRTRGYLYEQSVESPGSISVGTPAPRNKFLSTYRESIKGAVKAGKRVDPTILWAAKHAPEHISDAITQPIPHYKQTGGARQMQLHEGLMPSHVIEKGTMRARDLEPGDVHRISQAVEMQKQMIPDRVRTERRSYQTEGGQTKHVWRDVAGLPGSALNPKQWMPQGG